MISSAGGALCILFFSRRMVTLRHQGYSRATWLSHAISDELRKIGCFSQGFTNRFLERAEMLLLTTLYLALAHVVALGVNQ